jgi:hypothetical protein
MRLSLSVGEDGQIEPAQAVGVGKQVDLDDPPARDREAGHRERPSAPSHDESRGAVHERGLSEAGQPRERLHLLGHGRRASDLSGDPRAQGAGVDPKHDVGIEHLEERVEVAAARGREEGVHHFALAAPIGVRRRGGSPYAAAGPARELLRQAAVEGYTTAFWWAAGIFALGALVCGSLMRSGARPELGHGPAPKAEPARP